MDRDESAWATSSRRQQEPGHPASRGGTLQLDEVRHRKRGRRGALRRELNKDMCHAVAVLIVVAYLRRARDNIARTNRIAKELEAGEAGREQWKSPIRLCVTKAAGGKAIEV